MNCVLHVMLTFAKPSFPDMNVDPLFLFHVFCRSYVVTSPCIIKILKLALKLL